MSFHKLIGDIRAFICILDLDYVYYTGSISFDLRSTHLGLVEPEVEEGSCLIAGPRLHSSVSIIGIC